MLKWLRVLVFLRTCALASDIPTTKDVDAVTVPQCLFAILPRFGRGPDVMASVIRQFAVLPSTLLRLNVPNVHLIVPRSA